MSNLMNNDPNNVLLSVRDLYVEYKSQGKIVHAVNGVSFDLEAGKTLGLVGETGAGKTSVAKSLMRILPALSAKLAGGEVYFNGENLLELPESEMRKKRGSALSMIFQDPMTALNPVKTVLYQIAECVLLHNEVSQRQAEERAIEMLKLVGISPDRAREYPHQFSGGMKQRVVIAMALACNPQLLIADEPTTALDVTIQAQVLEMMRKLIKDFNTAMILITHDLGVVAEICDNVAVIYAGQIIEYGTKERIFHNPVHPYTKGLFGSLPDLSKKVSRLSPIHGLPPDPTKLPKGCSFSPRCPMADQCCREAPIDLIEIEPGHYCRCVKTTEAEG